MSKIPAQRGALDERIESLLASLGGERVDPKMLMDLIYDAVGLEMVNRSENRFRADWRGKSSILSTIQRPSKATLRPNHGYSLNFPDARHVAIQGENLEVMKIIERAYFGRIKMIYMNPPFNIGGELLVDDTINVFDHYRSYIKGDEDSDKIRIQSGSGHSEWMNSIYARLFVARNLLTKDGVIFVSIDDHESHHLRTMMDEIYGSENFVASFVWEKRYSPPPDAQDVGYVHENIICYRRSEDFSAGLLPMTDDQSARYTNPDNDPRGPWKAADYTCRYTSTERPTLYYPITNPNTGQEILPKKTRVWACSRSEHEKNVEEKRIWWGVDGQNSIPAKKKYLFEIKQGAIPKSILQHDEVGHTDEATKELRSHLPDLKLSPKPTRLMRHLLNIANVKSNDIVLDCYAGTGTLGEAIFNMDRDGVQSPSFILIEFPEKLKSQNITLSEAMFARLKSSASTSVNSACGFRVFTLEESNFKTWEVSSKDDADMIDRIDKHISNIKNKSDPESLLFEILLRAGYPLTTQYSTIELDEKKLFSIEEGGLLICVERELTAALIDAVAEMNPLHIIFLDEGFGNNDELKANAVQTFKSRSRADESEITFRTI